MPRPPCRETLHRLIRKCLIFLTRQNRALKIVGGTLATEIGWALGIGLKKLFAQGRELLPVMFQQIQIALRNPALQMRVKVVNVFRLRRINVTRDIEVIAIPRNLCQRHHTAIACYFALFGEHIDDLVNVLATQAVLVAVLDKALARIHHENAFAGVGIFLVQHDNAGGNPRAVKQVGRQTDNAFDIPLLHEILANIRLGIAPEQHPMRQNHRRFTRAFHGFEDVQQKRIIAVFGRGYAVSKPLKRVFLNIYPIRPLLVGKRRIRHHEIESFQRIGGFQK